MAISSVNTYNTVAENAYATQKKQVSGQEEAKVQSSKENLQRSLWMLLYQKLFLMMAI